MVLVTYGHAAAGDHHVGLGGSLHQRLFGRGETVLDTPQIDGLAVERRQEPTQDVTIGVVDGTGRKRLAGLDQLVAAGENRHAQAPHDIQFRQTHRRCQSQLLGAQTGTCRQHFVTGNDVVAPRADVVAGGHRAAKAHLVAVLLAVLLNDHRVGALGQGCSGENARRLPRRQRLTKLTRRDTLGDPQRSVRVADHVGGA